MGRIRGMGFPFSGLGALVGQSPGDHDPFGAQQANAQFGAQNMAGLANAQLGWPGSQEMANRLRQTDAWAQASRQNGAFMPYKPPCPTPTSCDYCRRPHSDSAGKRSCVGCGAPV